MSFFKRLANLGRGMVLAKKNSPSTGAVVDQELARDEVNPQPGPAAEAELARLKAERSRSGASEMTGSNTKADRSETSGASDQDRKDDRTEDEKTRVRGNKTL